jgi:hypothetical protein
MCILVAIAALVALFVFPILKWTGVIHCSWLWFFIPSGILFVFGAVMAAIIFLLCRID